MSQPMRTISIQAGLDLVTARLRASPASLTTVQVPTGKINLQAGARMLVDLIPTDIHFTFQSFKHSPRVLFDKLFPVEQGEPSSEPESSIGKPIYTLQDATNLSIPPKTSPERRRQIWNKFKEDMPPDRAAIVILQAPIMPTCLPSFSASVNLSAIDADYIEHLESTTLLYDTGAEISVISSGLLSTPFNDFLASAENQQYAIDEHNKWIQVSFHLGFTNTNVTMETIAVVRPLEKMPSKFNGIIFGQKGAIDCLIAKMIPRKFLSDMPESFWGEIHIERFYDYVTEETTEV